MDPQRTVDDLYKLVEDLAAENARLSLEISTMRSLSEVQDYYKILVGNLLDKYQFSGMERQGRTPEALAAIAFQCDALGWVLKLEKADDFKEAMEGMKQTILERHGTLDFKMNIVEREIHEYLAQIMP